MPKADPLERDPVLYMGGYGDTTRHDDSANGFAAALLQVIDLPSLTLDSKPESPHPRARPAPLQAVEGVEGWRGWRVAVQGTPSSPSPRCINRYPGASWWERKAFYSSGCMPKSFPAVDRRARQRQRSCSGHRDTALRRAHHLRRHEHPRE